MSDQRQANLIPLPPQTGPARTAAPLPPAPPAPPAQAHLKKSKQFETIIKKDEIDMIVNKAKENVRNVNVYMKSLEEKENLMGLFDRWRIDGEIENSK